MKKSIIIALAFLAINLLNAQNKTSFYGVIATYSSEYSGKEFPIKLTKGENIYGLNIEAYSFDNLSTKGVISFNGKHHDDFISSLNKAKEKYIEWSSVAEKNNIKEFDKYMDFKCKTGVVLFYLGDESYADFTVELLFKFTLISEDGVTKPILIAHTNKLTSEANEFITSKGLGFVFSNVEEIDTFLNTISKEKINNILSEAPKSDLFK